MRYKGTHLKMRKTADGPGARRARLRRIIPASTAAALALGGVTTVAVHAATAGPHASAAAAAHKAGSGKAGSSLPFSLPDSGPITGLPTVPGAQADGSTATSRELGALGTGVVDPSVKQFLTPKLLSEVPVGPGAVSKPVQAILTSASATTTLDISGIPQVAEQAYQRAATDLAASKPNCHLPWQLVAAIGRVESDHGRFGGSMLLPNGNTSKPIYGLPLDGRSGVALVRDTDGGRVDGDPNFDRAVGPLQFIPSTWATYGADGNGDGVTNINNIYDAALGAANFLCAGGGNMTNTAQETAAILRYNNADEYVHVVLALEVSYMHGDAAIIPTNGPAGALESGGDFMPNLPEGNGLTIPKGNVPALPVFVPTGSAPPAPKRTSGQSHPVAASKPSSPKAKAPAAPKAPQAKAPAPAKPPTKAPVHTPAPAPAPQPTAPSSPTTIDSPMGNPTPTSGQGGSSTHGGGSTHAGGSTHGGGSTTPGAPPVTGSTGTGSTPWQHSGHAQGPSSPWQPKPAQHGPKHHRPHFDPHQTADVGWAPAMRQVVVVLLTEPKSAYTHPFRPTHPGSQPTNVANQPTRKATSDHNDQQVDGQAVDSGTTSTTGVWGPDGEPAATSPAAS